MLESVIGITCVALTFPGGDEGTDSAATLEHFPEKSMP
jgi:hypothetical protein